MRILILIMLVMVPFTALAVDPATITTRSGKGAALTWSELDANFNNLRNTGAAQYSDNRTYVDAYIAATASLLSAIQAGQQSTAIGYTTKALLDADLAHAAGTIAVVTHDPTPGNNTMYVKVGGSGSGSWDKSLSAMALPFVQAESYANFAAAVAAVGTTPTMMLISTALTVTADLSVPATCQLWFLPGGSLAISSGKVLTLAAIPIAGPRQIFSGAGSVAYTSAAAIRQVMPEWTGTTQALFPTAIGHPVVSWSSRVDTKFADTDRRIGFVSQMVAGTDMPTNGSPSPAQAAMAGYFGGYAGAHTAALVVPIRSRVELTAADVGVVNTSGTAVTWVSGTKFRNDWVNGFITINNAVYIVSAVADDSHLTLASSAGSQTGVTYRSGTGGDAVQAQVYSTVDADTNPDSGRAAGGINIVSTGTAKSGNGISIKATNSPTNGWINGIDVRNFIRYGLYVSNPGDASAGAINVTNGSTGSSTISGGYPVLQLTGAAHDLLRLIPSADSDNQIAVLGTNAANNAVRWSITQSGVFMGLNLGLSGVPEFADNATAVAAGAPVGSLYRTGDLLKIVH